MKIKNWIKLKRTCTSVNNVILVYHFSCYNINNNYRNNNKKTVFFFYELMHDIQINFCSLLSRTRRRLEKKNNCEYHCFMKRLQCTMFIFFLSRVRPQHVVRNIKRSELDIYVWSKYGECSFDHVTHSNSFWSSNKCNAIETPC